MLCLLNHLLDLLLVPLPAAGKPSLVIPCVPSSDQPFWADLVQRRGLGPAWFPGAPPSSSCSWPWCRIPGCISLLKYLLKYLQPTHHTYLLCCAPAVHQLTKGRLAAGIEAGLRRLGEYTAAAEALAEEMAREDGVAAAADIIEVCLQ